MRTTNPAQLNLGFFFNTEVPPAPSAETGSLSISREIAAIIGTAIAESGLAREVISERISALIAHKLTVQMLNAYSAASKGQHNISLERAIAFDLATGTFALLKYYAAKCGGRVFFGRDALLAELGKAELLRDELNGQIKRIKHEMESAGEAKR